MFYPSFAIKKIFIHPPIFFICLIYSIFNLFRAATLLFLAICSINSKNISSACLSMEEKFIQLFVG